MLDQLTNSSLSREFVVVIMAMLPIAELRLALPVAITVFDMAWYKAFYLAIIGNLIPVPFLLLFFDGLSRLARRTKSGDRFVGWLMSRTARRSGLIEKYKYLGLVMFVAIPLPLTGAWTGCLGAYMLGLKFWRASASISVGVLCAAVIVTTLTLLGWVGAAIAIIALAIVLVLGAWKL